jgi:molybdopterin-guanine dinucleotide biosynthesis protein A
MTFSALWLAGGESRRMGRDKATIEIAGHPLWERQLELLRALAPEKIFVSARTTPAWLPGNVDLLLDDSPSRGPISGITKALVAMRTTHVIVLAVDMPFVTADELGRLPELVTKGCGVVPIIGERAEPLAAIYPAEAAVDFQSALTGSNFSVQSVVRTLGEAELVTFYRVPEHRGNLYRSVNEPGDFKEGRFETAL